MSGHHCCEITWNQQLSGGWKMLLGNKKEKITPCLIGNSQVSIWNDKIVVGPRTPERHIEAFSNLAPQSAKINRMTSYLSPSKTIWLNTVYEMTTLWLSLVMFKEKMMFWIKITTCNNTIIRYGHNNNHVVKVTQWSFFFKTTLTCGWKQEMNNNFPLLSQTYVALGHLLK